jgi:hypothetical protein
MAEALRTATHARHYRDTPQQMDEDGSRHWITRAANFVVVVTEAAEGAVLSRIDNPDEYMLLLPEVGASIEAGGERIEAKGDSLTIIPPGASRVSIGRAGLAVRVFSNMAADLLAVASNATIPGAHPR